MSSSRMLLRQRCNIVSNYNGNISSSITKRRGRIKEGRGDGKIEERNFVAAATQCHYRSIKNNPRVFLSSWTNYETIHRPNHYYSGRNEIDSVTSSSTVRMMSSIPIRSSSLVTAAETLSTNKSPHRFLSTAQNISPPNLPIRPSPPPPPTSSSSTQNKNNNNNNPHHLITPMNQTRQNAEMLFDALAPHLEYRTLRALSTKLPKFITSFAKQYSSSNGGPLDQERVFTRGGGPVQNLILKLDDLLMDITKTSFSTPEEGQKEQQHRYQQNQHEWIKPLLLQFFIGQSFVSSSTNLSSPSSATSPENNTTTMDATAISSSTTTTNGNIRQNEVWNHKTFVPNVNRHNHEQTVSILRAARTKSVQHPMFWSITQRKKERRKSKQQQQQQKQQQQQQHDDDEKDDDETDRYVARSLLLSTIHDAKSDTTLESEAEALACILADRLPSSSYDKLMETFASYAGVTGNDNDDDCDINKEDGSSSSSSSSTTKESGIRILYPNLYNAVKFHVHLVAKDVADFFYVDVGDGDGGGQMTNTEGTTMKTPVVDPRIEEAWKDWNAIRDESAQTFLNSQTFFVESLNRYYKEYYNDDNDNDDESLEDHDNYSSDANNGKGTIMRREEMANTIEELEFLRTRPSDGVKIGRDRSDQKNDGSEGVGVIDGKIRQRRVHLYFDGIMLNDNWSVSNKEEDDDDVKETDDMSSISTKIPPENRTIFIDNLPIDVDEEEIIDVYSRCGPVQTVTVYNLRPDLDPGPSSAKHLAEKKRRNRLSVPPPKRPPRGGAAEARRRRLRNRGVSGGPLHHHEHRNRTPVYAIVTFATEKGYKVASDAHLSIFGLVLRRHLVRSIQASTMTTLFIENIPPRFFSLDLEYKLSRALHPDIYVCLDVGQNDYSEPKSCEIMFPSFEVAFHAFQKLQQVDMGSDDCVMNWIKTSDDAMGYWTRKLGFDP